MSPGGAAHPQSSAPGGSALPVTGSATPTLRTLSIGANVNDPGHRAATFDQMVAAYYEQIDGLVEGGVDLLLPETAFDTLVLNYLRERGLLG